LFSCTTTISAQNAQISEVDKLVNLARAQVNTNLDSVTYFMDRAIEKAIESQETERTIHLFREKGYYYEIYNRLEYAVGIYDQAKRHALKTKNTSALLDVYTDIAIANRKLGNYQETKTYHTLALKLAQKENDLRGI
jgi:tetratricopeptide (TPR) repeat protein